MLAAKKECASVAVRVFLLFFGEWAKVGDKLVENLWKTSPERISICMAFYVLLRFIKITTTYIYYLYIQWLHHDNHALPQQNVL